MYHPCFVFTKANAMLLTNPNYILPSSLRFHYRAIWDYTSNIVIHFSQVSFSKVVLFSSQIDSFKLFFSWTNSMCLCCPFGLSSNSLTHLFDRATFSIRRSFSRIIHFIQVLKVVDLILFCKCIIFLTIRIENSELNWKAKTVSEKSVRDLKTRLLCQFPYEYHFRNTWAARSRAHPDREWKASRAQEREADASSTITTITTISKQPAAISPASPIKDYLVLLTHFTFLHLHLVFD